MKTTPSVNLNGSGVFRSLRSNWKTAAGSICALAALCAVAMSDVGPRVVGSSPMPAPEPTRLLKNRTGIESCTTAVSTNPLNAGDMTPRQLPSQWRPSPQYAPSHPNGLDDDMHMAHGGWQPAGRNPTTTHLPQTPEHPRTPSVQPFAYAPITAEARAGE